MAYVKPTGITDIAFDKENMHTHINIKQKIVGLNLENPSDIFAKLFALIQVKIPNVKKIYPEKILII